MVSLSNSTDWSDFLRRFATAAGADPWPGNPGVTEAELLKSETKLKIKLPPSYRTFLSASNGWKYSSTSVPPLRAVGDLKWFSKEYKEWFEAYNLADVPMSIMEKDYFNYAEPSDEFDVQHLRQALCISEFGDEAVLLLNPMVVWPDGEWEAWFFANWNPGAIRYRSFADWILHELSEISDEPFEHTLTPGELPTVYLDPPGKPNRRVRPREKVLVLEKVLAKLNSKKDRDRVKAVEQLRLFDDAQAVASLLDALKNDPSGDVRCHAAYSLGVLAPPEAVEALIAAIDDWEVTAWAIPALQNFEDERSAQYLLKTLEADGWKSSSAANVLSKRGDSRVIQPLLNALLDTSTRKELLYPPCPPLGQNAGIHIAEFQEDGLAALAPLATHSDREVRSRALAGISNLALTAKNKDTRRKALELYKLCVKAETDAETRRRMEMWIQIHEKKKLPVIEESPFT
jgi:HEAT repeat protein